MDNFTGEDDEEFENPSQLVSELTSLINDGSYETARKLFLQYIKNEDFQTAPVYFCAVSLCSHLAEVYGHSDKLKYGRYITKGYRYAKAGFAKDETHANCAKYRAIFLSMVSKYRGLYYWIKNSYKMREYWLKAQELNPGDAQVLKGMGMWCYEVAGWNFIQRKVAAALFPLIPRATYQEAIKLLTEAESKSMKTNAVDLLNIARCYMKLNRLETAKTYLEEIMICTAEDPDTENAKREAIDLWGK
ncbi:unnamed protein product [Calicophoron daubneyi]|uniref:Regulator of microtubule dynamics protein 1 n=1 Tax=Calicophoron daubneyi TaxID=300641 RepID=A0AAV2TV83_CALDB